MVSKLAMRNLLYLIECLMFVSLTPRKPEFAVNMEPVMVVPWERSSRRWRWLSTPSTTAFSAERIRKFEFLWSTTQVLTFWVELQCKAPSNWNLEVPAMQQDLGRRSVHVEVSGTPMIPLNVVIVNFTFCSTAAAVTVRTALNRMNKIGAEK
jgi:hypothetical protein